MQLRPDGGVTTEFSDFDALEGRWSLEGDALTLSFDIAGQHVDEVYDARLADGRLRLWSADVGRIFARPGASLPRTSAQTSEVRGPTAASANGIDYTLSLPPNYHLVPDGRGGQRWDHAAGEGLFFEVRTSERFAEPGAETASGLEPCQPVKRPLHVGSSTRGSGEDKKLIRISTRLCVPSKPLFLRCAAGHHRGHLLERERNGAEAVCRSLKRAE